MGWSLSARSLKISSWQAHAAEGFSKADVHVDWDQQVVTCPEGTQGISWLPSTYPKSALQFEVRFARKECARRSQPAQGR
jgi:transposase